MRQKPKSLPGGQGKDVAAMKDYDPMDEFTQLLTHTETARLLRVTVKTLYVWNSLGTGPKTFKINGSRRYDRRDVQEFLRQRYAQAMGQPSTVAA
jgi:predicted DNA-binding transcriptional regulator AlpA